jgi:hypothetical protein
MTGLSLELKKSETGIKKLRKTLFQYCNWMITLFERRLFDVQTVFWSVAIKTVDHLPLLKNVCPFTLHKWPKIKINKTELTIFKTVGTFSSHYYLFVFYISYKLFKQNNDDLPKDLCFSVLQVKQNSLPKLFLNLILEQIVSQWKLIKSKWGKPKVN